MRVDFCRRVWPCILLLLMVSADALPAAGASALPGAAAPGRPSAVPSAAADASVQSYGALCDGQSDDTRAIQAALDSGALAIEIPIGTCVVSQLRMPQTFGFVLRGKGSASRLKHRQNAAIPLISWTVDQMRYSEQTIRDLMLIGTDSHADLVQTAGAGGLTIRDVYIHDVPKDHTGIFVDGTADTYTHDIRLSNVQIYSNTAAFAGIRFGTHASDSSATDIILNGNFNLDYAMYFDVGAQTVRVTDAHIYNTAKNIVRLAGHNDELSFNGVVFDNALGDLVTASQSSHINFTDCYFEGIRSHQRGLFLDGTHDVNLISTRFTASEGARAAVAESTAASDTRIFGSSVPDQQHYESMFDLSSPGSVTAASTDPKRAASSWGFSGATAAPQPPGSTAYLGVNGAQTQAINTVYVVPSDATLTELYVAVDRAPDPGGRFVFTLLEGSTEVASLTVEGRSFGGEVKLNVPVHKHAQIALRSAFSSNSGAANVRYSVSLSN